MLQQKNHQVITNQSTILQTLLENGNHLSTIVPLYFQWVWLLQCSSSYLLFFFTLSYLRSDRWFLNYDWQYYLCLHSPLITYFVTTCKLTVISSYLPLVIFEGRGAILRKMVRRPVMDHLPDGIYNFGMNRIHDGVV